MSRIGKKPINIPQGTTVALNQREISAQGPKGNQAITIVKEVLAEMKDNQIHVTPASKEQKARAMWGLSRTLIANLIEGVTNGFSKTLEIHGVGYRAAIQGKNLQLILGYSHDILYPIPDDVHIQTTKPTEIIVSGINKQRVGQVAAEIRQFHKPEPYKGKGVRYAGEYIFRKEGKKK